MEKQANLFYEDAKQLKKVFLIFAILFYTGLLNGICVIILYRFISPVSLLTYYQPSGEDIIVTVLCAILAVSFTIFLAKAERFNYYLSITENEIEFFSKGKVHTYNTVDIKNYEFIRKYLGFLEFKLLLPDGRSITIMTKKAQELQAILNTIIAKNIEKTKN